MSDVPAGKVPILESAGAALRYFTENFTRWIPAALFVGALTGFLMVRFPDFYIPQLTGGDPVLLPNQILPLMGFSLLVMTASISFTNGVYRHALFEEYTPPFGIQFAADELRVIGVFLGLGLIFGIVGIFAMFIFGIMLTGMVANSGVDLTSGSPEEVAIAIEAIASGPASIIIAILTIMALLFVIFAMVRLTFIQAATVAEGRMMAFSTWSLTHGNFFRVLGALLLVSLPVVIIHGIFQQILVQILPLQPGAVLFIFGLLSGASGTLLGVVSVALVAYLYQGLRPSESTDKVFE